MNFVKIQDKKTLEIIQWRIDGKRVKKSDYDFYLELENKWKHGQASHLTDRTKTGNFRHSFYTYML